MTGNIYLNLRGGTLRPNGIACELLRNKVAHPEVQKFCRGQKIDRIVDADHAQVLKYVLIF